MSVDLIVIDFDSRIDLIVIGVGTPAATVMQAHLAATDPHPQYMTAAETALGYQPLDPDLTAVAALDSSTAGAIASDGAGWIKKTYAQFKTALGLIKADVGLGNVDNTSDANKPVSTAQAAADAVVLSSAEAYADALVVGLWDDRGSYDASGNVFPSTGGSGAAGALKKGDIWTVSVGGTLGGSVVGIGDTVRALADAPGQTVGNWAVGENNIGYVPENVASKDATGGYVGLSGFKIKLKNALGTVTSFFQTAATVARTWTMPDKDGTVAMTSDVITDHTGLSSIGTNTHAQIDSALARVPGEYTWAQLYALVGMVDGQRAVVTDIPAGGGRSEWYYDSTAGRWRVFAPTLIAVSATLVTGAAQTAEQYLAGLSLPSGILKGATFEHRYALGKTGTTDAWGTSFNIRLGAAGTTADAAIVAANIAGTFNAASRSYGATAFFRLTSNTTVTKLGPANTGVISFNGTANVNAPNIDVTVPDVTSNALVLGLSTTMGGSTNQPQVVYQALFLQP